MTPSLNVSRATSSSLHVLLVDDHATIRTAIGFLLRRLGHCVDVAADGTEALKATARHPYDLILMDIQMPVMDGLEATRRLHRRRPPGSGPRIFALTADATPEDRARYH
jgi:CheY-like chemotaxis protein